MSTIDTFPAKRSILFFCAFAGCLSAGPQPGLVQGKIFDLQSDEVSIRSAPGEVYRFTFDSRTWIEREKSRVTGASLRTGELLEVISDRDGRTPRYARLIHVLDQTVPRPPVREGYYRLYRGRGEALSPPVTLTYSGVVVRLNGDAGLLLLRTRFDGLKTLAIQPDTHWWQEGREVRATEVEPQTHVWVQARPGSDGILEAERIVWGNPLQARDR